MCIRDRPSIYCQTLPNGSRVCMHYPCTLALTFAEAFISSCKLMSMRRSTPEYRDCRFRQEICCVKTISVIPGSYVPVIQSNCSSTIRKHASVPKEMCIRDRITFTSLSGTVFQHLFGITDNRFQTAHDFATGLPGIFQNFHILSLPVKVE